ncbi:hypothetical protein AHAS_Ahas15G0339200 [Arachis hypogaea]
MLWLMMSWYLHHVNYVSTEIWCKDSEKLALLDFNSEKDGCLWKEVERQTIQEWQGYYINYKLMKKRVRHSAQQIQLGTQD